MKPAIRVENVSKFYHIGARQKSAYGSLRETVAEACAAPFRKVKELGSSLVRGQDGSNRRSPEDSFWALKDVSFEVQAGEVVGLLGRNGAGKSTLLKIMSRITEATAGRIELRGRVGSLLEVGTGFHPELTGRENIYLNGAILGMTRREIQRKFDEIVAFAEIDQFLDTPVKRYSSGMYVRLAFAVAAHLEPEVLLIDEVLAVGDLAFQKKCLGKVGELTHSGRTVLLVTHNVASVANICTSCVLLEQGALLVKAAPTEAIRLYTSGFASSTAASLTLTTHPTRRPGSECVFRALRLRNAAGEVTDQFHCGDAVVIEFQVERAGELRDYHFGVAFEDSLGAKLFKVSTYLCPSWVNFEQSSTWVTCFLESLPLAPGRYSLSLSAGPLPHVKADVLEKVTSLEVHASDFYRTGRLPNSVYGPMLLHSQWRCASEAC